MSVEQLMTYIQGPDFCQGGRVMGIEGVKDYLTTGKGRIIVRKSGTEPVIRIMAEGENERELREVVREIAAAVRDAAA